MKTLIIKNCHLAAARQFLFILFVFILSICKYQQLFSNGIKSQAKQDSVNIESFVKKYTETLDFNGTILAVQKGRTILHSSYGIAIQEWNIPNTNSSKYQIASISKPMTAFLVTMLVEEGKLKYEDPVSKYLPDFPKDKGDSITIHQLLTHTGGIGHYQDAPEIEAWKERLPLKKEELIVIYGNMPLVASPGSKYYYSSFGYNILAYICEAATGESFPVLMKKYVFDPAGMKNSRLTSETDIIPYQTRGYENTQLEGLKNTTYLHPNICIGSGDVICTAEDLYLFSNYVIKSERVSKTTRDLIFSKYSSTGSGFYGYGWMMGKSTIAACEYYSHGGKQNGYQSEMWYYPEHDITIIILSNTRYQEWEWGNDPQRPSIAGLRNCMLRILHNQSVDEPNKPAAKEFSGWIASYGIDRAIVMYREFREKLPEGFYLSEIETNMLGYNYYNKKKEFEIAKSILLQNVTDYPNSYNVYDSMGWLYRQVNDEEHAKEWYRKGLNIYEVYPEENKRWLHDVESAREWLNEKK